MVTQELADPQRNLQAYRMALDYWTIFDQSPPPDCRFLLGPIQFQSHKMIKFLWSPLELKKCRAAHEFFWFMLTVDFQL